MPRVEVEVRAVHAFEGSTIGTEGAGESASIVDSKMGIANAGKGSAIEGAAIGYWANRRGLISRHRR